jgi:hypothetical protein
MGVIMRLLSLLLLVGLGACATPVQVPVVADDATPQMFDPRAVNPIAIERVVDQVPRGQQIGVIKSGLLCVPHLAITAGSGQVNITDASYLDAIQHEFNLVDYPITTSPTELFTTAAADATRFRLAARIIDIKTNICFPLGGFGDLSSGTAEAYVQIEWQAFDNQTRSVIMKTTTSGSGTVKSSAPSPGVLANDMAAAMATRQFIAGPEFQALSVRH